MKSIEYLQQPRQPKSTQPVDEAALIAERRKRREAIKAKYKGQETSKLDKTFIINDTSALIKQEPKALVDHPQASSE